MFYVKLQKLKNHIGLYSIALSLKVFLFGYELLCDDEKLSLRLLLNKHYGIDLNNHLT